MLRKKRFSVVVLSLLLISLNGCSHKNDARYWARHLDRLQAVLTECNAMNELKAMENPQCEFAIQVFKEAVEASHTLMHNPQDLGKRILMAQTKCVQLKEQVQTLEQTIKKDDVKKQKYLMFLKDQIKVLEIKIDVMLALAAEHEGM